MKKIFLVFIAGFVMLFTSCASIVGANEQTLRIKSNPSKANIKIVDEKNFTFLMVKLQLQ